MYAKNQVVEPAPTVSKSIITHEKLLDRGLVAKVKDEFAAEWYEATYSPQLAADRLPGETALAFYLRIGGRADHDPNPSFSEVLYRQKNRDVMSHMVQAKSLFGFLHWLQFRDVEKHRLPIINKPLFQRVRELVNGIDPEFLLREYPVGQDQFPHPADFYFANVKADLLSPSEEFSEEGYRWLNTDIVASIKSGDLLSGYDHYLKTRFTEKRKLISYHQFIFQCDSERKRAECSFRKQVLTENLPGITHLAALDMISTIEFYSDPVQVELTGPAAPGGLMVLVPHFLPEILFGGYLAFFDYLDALKKRTGIKLTLYVVNQVAHDIHCSNLIRMRAEYPKLLHLFDNIEKFDKEHRAVRIPPNFSVISYCAELHYIARSISNATRRLPIFFIQEFEPDFHANTDMQSFIANAFLIPHLAIYNSAKLFEYFLKKTQVVSRRGESYRYAVFENAIKPVPKNAYEVITRRLMQNSKRLIFYGRPEAHAARNHFAMFVCGLKAAIRLGVFADGNWEFISIGSLSYEGKIDLDGCHKLQIRSKLPKAEYEMLLTSGDIGVSFITSPHPGIVHFQMAAFGLPTVTNVTELRSRDWLAEQNRNLIGVEMTPESIAEGIREAIKVLPDADRRWTNANAVKIISKDDAYEGAVQFLEDALLQ